jgi:GTP-binding protein Era
VTAQGKDPRCGYVALVGRPNVGKSTLLNHLLGQKLSITSRKPQTTRHQVLGIKTIDRAQLLFVDTPGMHSGEGRALNRVMNRAAGAAISGVDVVVLVSDRGEWTDDDQHVLDRALHSGAPLILVLNKVDRVAHKDSLLPVMAGLAERGNFAAIVPVSALQGDNLQELEREIVAHLPEGPFLFAEDEITDRSARFLAAEAVQGENHTAAGRRVALFHGRGDRGVRRRGRGHRISPRLILVEREGQKRIIIGKGGTRLRSIGTEARLDLERLLGQKVMLRLWVKVRSGWADDERALRSLGYDEGR